MMQYGGVAESEASRLGKSRTICYVFRITACANSYCVAILRNVIRKHRSLISSHDLSHWEVTESVCGEVGKNWENPTCFPN